LERAITRYKYEGKMGWALIFGRILAGFLEQEAPTFEPFDLIIASPTYTGSGGREFHHTGRVLRHAATELGPGRIWPFDSFDNPVLVKTERTESFVGKGFSQRREIALELREALKVTDVERTRGRAILVYDDVFTTGGTLNEIAWVPRTIGGARLVCGVTLCRQPWRGG
jgi:predicted amidophosphoribosyltransferase